MRSECSYHALLRNPRPRALCRLPLIVKLGSTHDRKGDDRKPSPGPDTSAEGSRFGARQPQSTRGSEARMAPYSEHSSTSKNGCPKNSPASRLTPLSLPSHRTKPLAIPLQSAELSTSQASPILTTGGFRGAHPTTHIRLHPRTADSLRKLSIRFSPILTCRPETSGPLRVPLPGSPHRPRNEGGKYSGYFQSGPCGGPRRKTKERAPWKP